MNAIKKLNALKLMKQGTRIMYTPWFGDGVTEEVSFWQLTERGQEYIVNVELNNGSLRWGYLHQIIII